MNVVLVLNREKMKNVRIMVRLKSSGLKQRVMFLLEKDRGREAFELMLKKAEIADYLPPGRKPVQKPSMVLMEDLL